MKTELTPFSLIIGFKHGWALKEHTLTHMDPATTHKCKVCSRVFQSVFSLRNHRQIHNKPMQCETCGFIAMSKADLARHVATHSVERRKYICDQCGHQFLIRSGLQAHMRMNHDPLFSPLFECKVCHRKYRSNKTLKQHEETHMGLIFICEFCDKQFTSKRYIWEHVYGRGLCTKQSEESKKLKRGKDGSNKNFLKLADAVFKTILAKDLPAVQEQEKDTTKNFSEEEIGENETFEIQQPAFNLGLVSAV